MKTKEEILDDLSQKVGLINFKNAVKHVWLKQWSCSALIRLTHSAMKEYSQERIDDLRDELIGFCCACNMELPRDKDYIDLVDEYLKTRL